VLGPGGLAQHHRQDRPGHAEEDGRQEEEDEAADPSLTLDKGARDDGELAHEEAEGGRAGDGEEAGQK
jgi:hypothetical protein